MRAAGGRRFVFLDEAGAKTNFARRTGWAKRGERLKASAPAGHWHTTTLMAAVGLGGVAAAMAFPGATDAAAFRAFCRKVLAPELQPGDVVVLDNLAPHKDKEAVAALESAGAEVWPLPPYSPDLNPIEHLFSKIKESLRQAEARTEPELIRAMGRALDAVTPQDCANTFRHCGYRND